MDKSEEKGGGQVRKENLVLKRINRKGKWTVTLNKRCVLFLLSCQLSVKNLSIFGIVELLVRANITKCWQDAECFALNTYSYF